MVASAGGAYCALLGAVLAGALLLFAGLGVAGGFLGGFGFEMFADLFGELVAVGRIVTDLRDAWPGYRPVAAQW